MTKLSDADVAKVAAAVREDRDAEARERDAERANRGAARIAKAYDESDPAKVRDERRAQRSFSRRDHEPGARDGRRRRAARNGDDGADDA